MISGNYANDWAMAIERTERFGLNVPAHVIQPFHYLTESRQIEFPRVVQRGLGDLGFTDVVAQCMAIHYRLAPVIEEWLSCPVLYTLGWIDDGTDTGMFKFDDAFIADKLKNGQSGSTVNLHAWLTLPSMEVIDVALASTIAVVKKMPEGYGGVIAQPADGLKGFAYKPMLIGPGFLRRAGLLIEGSVFTL